MSDRGSRLAAFGAVVAAAVAAGCGGSPPPPPGTQLADAVVAAIEAAHAARQPWRCAAADGPGLVEETVQVDGRAWQLSGVAMRAGAPAGRAEGAFVVGVIADAGGAAPETVAALGRLKAKLADADVVISLGGMGASRAELEATLGALADRAPWPLVAVPGDLEPVAELAAAIGALRGRGAVVIDGRLARRIELPGAVIAVVPGSGAAARLVPAGDGCGYRAADVVTTLDDLAKREGIRILASAEAPRTGAGGGASGELALALATDGTRPIEIALHGPTTEAPTPARTGRRDGAAVTISPGSSDATARLPAGRRAATAGLLSIGGGGWRWRPVEDAVE